MVAFEGVAAGLVAVAALALAGVAVATYAAGLAESRLEYISPQIERLLGMTAEQAFAVGDSRASGLPFRHTYRLLNESSRGVSVQRHLLDVTERRQLRLLGAAEFEAPEEPQRVPTAPLGGQEAILVVEDEPALRVLEEMTLEDAGYVVYAAADAEEALGLAGRHGVDLVVVDAVLPGLSGTQLIDELAARGFDFPAVFVSGYGGHENAIRGLETRAAAVVAKPFAPEDLLRAVREALDAAAATVVPLRAKEATQSQLVRCLGCGAHYRRPLPHLSLASTTCPQCQYVGWASVDSD